MEESGKKNNLLVVILLILLIAACGFIVYDKFLKKDNSQNDILSNEAALSLIKEKHNEVNNFFGDFKSSERSAGDKVNDVACYYSTLDAFKTKFYSVYSKELEFKDVFHDYADYETADYQGQEAYAHETAYAIKDNKVYIDNACKAGGLEVKIIDYKIVNITEDKIEANINFKYIDNFVYDDNDTEEVERSESMILVREKDGQGTNWKVKKTLIIENCDSLQK